ncbi:MAG: glutamine--tRNA ligase/YqeY domain fusion protein [Rhodothermales bacterium]
MDTPNNDETKAAVESTDIVPANRTGSNFIRTVIEEELRNNTFDGRVVTRFPPEPNGYLHIGHAKAICLNFGLALDYNGACHLRFDDTNPETEDIEYVKAIKRDVRWLGFDWNDKEFYASDYFEQLYDWAVTLIKKGKAYVDDLSEEEIRAYRGSVTEPGLESPYRDRSVQENLDLFEKMRAGEFEDGSRVLRAKIDMASPNMKMRDPLMYRIRHATHYRRGDAWCLYPMYDWAHGQSDAIEGITNSICTLEFDNNRELYDWFLDNLEINPRPFQYEFARLNLDYMVMSKRKLLQLVEEGHVNGWDDPRMPTIAGLRRRGVTPESIRQFCERIGITKVDSRVDIGMLEHSIRDDLNYRAPRVMCVLRPLKVIITNYPEDQVEWLDAPYWPHDVPNEGSRPIPFTRELYIEREDFREDPPRKFYRLAPGREVRLRYGYFITCVDVVKEESTGEVIELHCTYDPATRGGDAPDGRKVKGTLHWVSANHSIPTEVRLYDRLFRVANPEEGSEDFKAYLNPESVVILPESRVEPSVKDDPPETRYQFERQGYFWPDPVESSPDSLVFNRIVPLRDTWAKLEKAPHPSDVSTRPAEKPPRQKESEKSPVTRSKEDVIAELQTLSPASAKRFSRYTDIFGLSVNDARVLAGYGPLAHFFEQALAVHNHPKDIANWIVNELLGMLDDKSIEEIPFSGDHFGALVAMIKSGTISGRTAKEVLADMIQSGSHPEEIVREKALQQLANPDTLLPIINQLVTENPDKVALYQAGKTGLLGFFVGQVMRTTRGTANPQLVKELVQEKLRQTTP